MRVNKLLLPLPPLKKKSERLRNANDKMKLMHRKESVKRD
jgi:hypothetical protein